MATPASPSKDYSPAPADSDPVEDLAEQLLQVELEAKRLANEKQKNQASAESLRKAIPDITRNRDEFANSGEVLREEFTQLSEQRSEHWDFLERAMGDQFDAAVTAIDEVEAQRQDAEKALKELEKKVYTEEQLKAVAAARQAAVDQAFYTSLGLKAMKERSQKVRALLKETAQPASAIADQARQLVALYLADELLTKTIIESDVERHKFDFEVPQDAEDYVVRLTKAQDVAAKSRAAAADAKFELEKLEESIQRDRKSLVASRSNRRDLLNREAAAAATTPDTTQATATPETRQATRTPSATQTTSA